jgi:multidrug efflux pump subunit AcrA (membrane-fusion protein)
LAALDARLTANGAHLAELDDLLGQDELSAPFAGTVELHGNPIIVRLVNLESIYVRAALPESRLAEVQIGAVAVFEPAAESGRELTGTVTDISVEGIPTPTGTVFFVSARFDDPGALQPGMSGTMTFSDAEAVP